MMSPNCGGCNTRQQTLGLQRKQTQQPGLVYATQFFRPNPLDSSITTTTSDVVSLIIQTTDTAYRVLAKYYLLDYDDDRFCVRVRPYLSLKYGKPMCIASRAELNSKPLISQTQLYWSSQYTNLNCQYHNNKRCFKGYRCQCMLWYEFEHLTQYLIQMNSCVKH